MCTPLPRPPGGILRRLKEGVVAAAGLGCARTRGFAIDESRGCGCTVRVQWRKVNNRWATIWIWKTTSTKGEQRESSVDCKPVLRGRSKLSVIEWDSIEAFAGDKLAIDYVNWWLLNLPNYGNWFTVASVSCCLHFVLVAKTTEEFIHEGKVRPSVARWSAREITTNEECEIMGFLKTEMFI